ncbi:probable mitochondrial intermediate peptidase, mitochondrial isoform X2 [Phalaenopsis equestris]|uniref:probable mitochondrial intermediate peptidase, mitochondrial isoform X2 n=1 Tax=Phalaenopsis equestris TaxID=78828 RepID=UPI0009E369ED|nr:probable mitochondrial intermediate peptidase, mitochondrial isoform X2 [Phalaenopsis equestris]
MDFRSSRQPRVFGGLWMRPSKASCPSADDLVSRISQMPPSEEVIKAMDDISNTVCSVIDSAELCRNTHPDREFVEEANKASMRISEYLHFLNTNHTLYNAVLIAEQVGSIQSEEARRAAHSLRVDFEKGGIHLPSDKLERVNQLNAQIAQLSRQFNENIISDPGHVDVFPASYIPKNMQHHFKPIYRQLLPADNESLGLREKRKEKGFRLATDSSNLSSILKWVSHAEVRKQAYIRGNSVPYANLFVIDKLISTRHELAKIMGYRSYAEFAIRSNMAASPNVVMDFLLSLSNTVRQRADAEFKLVQDYKRTVDNDVRADLEPWDEAYFTGKMKSSAFDLDSSVIASYFPTFQCLEGLKLLAKSVFGVTLSRMSFSFGESWHPDVMKFLLHHPQEGDMGFLYLDLYSRDGKYPGCAHFAVRGGRRLSDAQYQLPIVALVCNFPNSQGSSISKLNHWDVETLFHEFGHALHSLLSRTDYQHFSGTRVVLDLAETPSNLFEYYAWDYRVLKMFGRHYSTGEIIPEKLVNSMNHARNMFSAMELQRQIFYSLVDLTLFGEQSADPMDTISIVADLKRKYTSWKHVEDGTHWHTRFSHLVNYGAGYYSYLYAKCFAATIWEKVCQDDPLSLATGTAIRTKFLQYGGAKHPSDLLRDLAGHSIVRNYNEGIVPDTSSLCKELNF